jgi:hypothetical protein
MHLSSWNIPLRRRLHVVAVGWDGERTAATCRMIDESLARSRTPVGRRMLVANADLKGVEAVGYEILQGDNRGLDIGAMGDGVRAVLRSASVRSGDCLLVTNDMLPAYEKKRPVLTHVSPRLIRYVAASDALAGKVWSSGKTHTVNGLPSKAWVQSHCFFIGVGLARRLDLPDLLTQSGAGALGFDSEANFTTDDSVDDGFAAFIEHGLVLGRSTTSGWRWSRAREWDPEHAEYLSLKATSILRERLLSASVVSAGGALLDLATIFSPSRWNRLPAWVILSVRTIRGAGRTTW